MNCIANVGYCLFLSGPEEIKVFCSLPPPLRALLVDLPKSFSHHYHELVGYLCTA